MKKTLGNRRNSLPSGLLLCVFLSGAAGLIYQVAWSKALGLVFGHAVYAIATVLAAFMTGLAVGSAYWGRWSERRPQAGLIRLYSQIELLCAVSGALRLRRWLRFERSLLPHIRSPAVGSRCWCCCGLLELR